MRRTVMSGGRPPLIGSGDVSVERLAFSVTSGIVRRMMSRSIKPIMLISGVLTTTMIYAAISPSAALQSNFGESLNGPLAELIVRNWGVLIALVGLMLIYGAFDVASRRLALLVAAASKIAFIGLVLANGSRYLGYSAGIAVAIDAVMVVVFVIYLVTSRPHESKQYAGV